MTYDPYDQNYDPFDPNWKPTGSWFVGLLWLIAALIFFYGLITLLGHL